MDMQSLLPFISGLMLIVSWLMVQRRYLILDILASVHSPGNESLRWIPHQTELVCPSKIHFVQQW